MKRKIYSYIFKLSLVNKDNFFYIFFKFIYKLSKLDIFYTFALVNNNRFKNIPNYYLYFEKIINSYSKSKNVFYNSNVLEIGGGEIWGMMPVAIKYGAKSYTNIDFLIKKNIINSKYLWKSFLKKNQNYIKIEKLKKFKFYNLPIKIENFNQANKYDTIISVSCLEHVKDVESFFFNLKKNTTDKTTHLHLVNFSNHLDKKQPFKYIYETNKNYFLEKYNPEINLLRISDYINILNKNNYIFKVHILKKTNIKKVSISNYWKINYNLNDLSIVTAIIVIEGFK